MCPLFPASSAKAPATREGKARKEGPKGARLDSLIFGLFKNRESRAREKRGKEGRGKGKRKEEGKGREGKTTHNRGTWGKPGFGGDPAFRDLPGFRHEPGFLGSGGRPKAGPFGCFSGKSAPPVEIPPPLWVWGIFVPHDKKKHTPRLLTYPPGTGARVVGGGI